MMLPERSFDIGKGLLEKGSRISRERERGNEFPERRGVSFDISASEGKGG